VLLSIIQITQFNEVLLTWMVKLPIQHNFTLDSICRATNRGCRESSVEAKTGRPHHPRWYLDARSVCDTVPLEATKPPVMCFTLS